MSGAERQEFNEVLPSSLAPEGQGERRLLLKLYGHLPDRNLRVYSVKASREIGLFYLEFWHLGTVLHELLSGDLPAPGAGCLSPARRLVGPHGSFRTSDDLLLFCLYHLVAGYSQRELGEKFYARKDIKNVQSLVSRWWTRAAPFFQATLEYCCVSSEHTLQMLAYRLRKLALAHRAQRPQPKRRGQTPSVDLIALVGARCPLFVQHAAGGSGDSRSPQST